jgi:hypothetical protein
MKLWEVGADAVREHQGLVAAVVGLADRSVDTHLGGHPGDDEAVDASVAQQQLEVRRVEAALARLVHDHLARKRRELRHDVVTYLDAHENPAVRAGTADPHIQATSRELGGRTVGKVGPVSLTRMDHEHAGVPGSREHLRQRLDHALQE